MAIRYRPNPYRRTPVPSKAERHVMNRMGYGATPELLRQVRAAGGTRRWFERQLAPGGVPESPMMATVEGWFPEQRRRPLAKWEGNKAKTMQTWEYARDLGCLTMLRRVYTRRPLQEVMTEFWANHLHIAANADMAWVHRYDYEQLLRRHALGRFDDLLVAASTHPAMTLWLDNWRSTKNAPNENQGREVLELHTVGLTGGYTEQMVKDSAKILSGYDVDVKGSWEGFYNPDKHTTGPVSVLGFTAANSSADGREVARNYLRYLARHPATARTIATKLVLRFVSDDPNPALVATLAKAYLDAGTDMRAPLRALFDSPAFWAAADEKVRTPVDDLIATTRVLRPTIAAPATTSHFARSMAWTHGGLAVYQWPRPDGPPESNSPWCSATRMISSYSMHWNMSAGWWPVAGVRYRKPVAFLPQRRMRFDALVDHLCRVLLGRRSTPRLLEAACVATGTGPREIVTRDHPVMSWKWVKLAGTLLDSPQHMSR